MSEAERKAAEFVELVDCLIRLELIEQGKTEYSFSTWDLERLLPRIAQEIGLKTAGTDLESLINHPQNKGHGALIAHERMRNPNPPSGGGLPAEIIVRVDPSNQVKLTGRINVLIHRLGLEPHRPIIQSQISYKDLVRGSMQDYDMM